MEEEKATSSTHEASDSGLSAKESYCSPLHPRAPKVFLQNLGALARTMTLPPEGASGQVKCPDGASDSHMGGLDK